MKLVKRVFCICFALLLGCAGVRGREVPDEIGAEDYQKLLNEWTKEAKVYQDFETKLISGATFKSWEFRRAYVEKYARIYLLEAEQKREKLEEERMISNEENEFFLSIYTPGRELDDFNKDDSDWKIYLLDDRGNILEPTEIEKAKENLSLLQELYPYITPWSSQYKLIFSQSIPGTQEPFITAETGYIKLIITSPGTRAVMTWELR
jgi:hypothetical protein